MSLRQAPESITMDDIRAAQVRILDFNSLKIDEESSNMSPPIDDLNIFRARVPAGSSVLDAGCATAVYAAQFSDYAYTGIDISPKLIEVARARHPHLHFRVADFHQLAMPNRMFDAIWCGWALGFEPKRTIDRAVSEFRRVVKPGGIIQIIMNYSLQNHEGFLDVHSSYDGIYFACWGHEEFYQMLARHKPANIQRFLREDADSMTFLITN